MVVSFEHLSAEQFEEFCYDLLICLEFSNLNWRKGSNSGVTSADRGRDIEAELQRNVVGSLYTEKWFVECKRLKHTASKEVVENLFAWADTDGADAALLIVSGFLSNQAKEYVEKKRTKRTPFRIHIWEAKDIERHLAEHLGLARRYGLTVPSKAPKTLAEIRVENLPGVERWYEYTSISDGKIKYPVLDYIAEAAGLVLNDKLPMAPIRLEPKYYLLKAVEPEQDGSFVTMQMIFATETPRRLGEIFEVAGIKMRVVGYHGESKEFGINPRR